MKDELSNQAGLNPRSDGYAVGAIAAYNDLLNIDMGEITDGD